MVDAILRSISSSLDDTIAQLDRLHSESQNRRLQNLQRLEQIVAGLGTSVGGDDPAETPQVERRERSEDRRPSPPDLPFVALPQRTTSHGGPWGPAMREKLTRIALEKQGW